MTWLQKRKKKKQAIVVHVAQNIEYIISFYFIIYLFKLT